jgi:hypothetical protein
MPDVGFRQWIDKVYPFTPGLLMPVTLEEADVSRLTTVAEQKIPERARFSVVATNIRVGSSWRSRCAVLRLPRLDGDPPVSFCFSLLNARANLEDTL